MGCTFGFFIGCIVKNELAGLMINQFCIVVMNFGSGLFINNNTTNIFVRFLTHVSPFRYSSEAMMRCFLKNKPYTELLFDYFNFTLGDEKCLQICFGFFILFFVMSWLAVEMVGSVSNDDKLRRVESKQ